MRIAYLCADSHIPVFGSKGASIHVQEMVRAFVALGHEVTVFAVRRGAPAQALDAEIVEATPPTLAAQTSSLDDAARARDKELRAMAVSDSIATQMQSHHRDRPFDFVYERYSLFSTAGVDASRVLGIPCIVEVNSPLVLEQQRYRSLHHVARAQTVEAAVFSGAEVLVTVSAQVRDYVVSKGAAPCATHVLPNAVDRGRFHPRVSPTPIPAAADRFVIGFTGSLKPWHGVDVLADAFRALCEFSSDYHLLVVGDGPLKSWLEGYASGARLREHITLMGWIANAQVPSVIGAMDAAVAPYPDIDDFYFSPLKLAEYMAVGKPVVASSIGQVAESIDDGITGLLVPPGDAYALAEALERVRHDIVLRNALGQAAAAAVEERTWERSAQRVLGLAASLLAAA